MVGVVVRMLTGRLLSDTFKGSETVGEFAMPRIGANAANSSNWTRRAWNLMLGLRNLTGGVGRFSIGESRMLHLGNIDLLLWVSV